MLLPSAASGGGSGGLRATAAAGHGNVNYAHATRHTVGGATTAAGGAASAAAGGAGGIGGPIGGPAGSTPAGGTRRRPGGRRRQSYSLVGVLMWMSGVLLGALLVCFLLGIGPGAVPDTDDGADRAPQGQGNAAGEVNGNANAQNNGGDGDGAGGKPAAENPVHPLPVDWEQEDEVGNLGPVRRLPVTSPPSVDPDERDAEMVLKANIQLEQQAARVEKDEEVRERIEKARKWKAKRRNRGLNGKDDDDLLNEEEEEKLNDVINEHHIMNNGIAVVGDDDLVENKDGIPGEQDGDHNGGVGNADHVGNGEVENGEAVEVPHDHEDGDAADNTTADEEDELKYKQALAKLGTDSRAAPSPVEGDTVISTGSPAVEEHRKDEADSLVDHVGAEEGGEHADDGDRAKNDGTPPTLPADGDDIDEIGDKAGRKEEENKEEKEEENRDGEEEKGKAIVVATVTYAPDGEADDDVHKKEEGDEGGEHEEETATPSNAPQKEENAEGTAISQQQRRRGRLPDSPADVTAHPVIRERKKRASTPRSPRVRFVSYTEAPDSFFCETQVASAINLGTTVDVVGWQQGVRAQSGHPAVVASLTMTDGNDDDDGGKNKGDNTHADPYANAHPSLRRLRWILSYAEQEGLADHDIVIGARNAVAAGLSDEDQTKLFDWFARRSPASLEELNSVHVRLGGHYTFDAVAGEAGMNDDDGVKGEAAAAGAGENHFPRRGAEETAIRREGPLRGERAGGAENVRSPFGCGRSRARSDSTAASRSNRASGSNDETVLPSPPSPLASASSSHTSSTSPRKAETLAGKTASNMFGFVPQVREADDVWGAVDKEEEEAFAEVEQTVNVFGEDLNVVPEDAYVVRDGPHIPSFPTTLGLLERGLNFDEESSVAPIVFGVTGKCARTQVIEAKSCYAAYSWIEAETATLAYSALQLTAHSETLADPDHIEPWILPDRLRYARHPNHRFLSPHAFIARVWALRKLVEAVELFIQSQKPLSASTPSTQQRWTCESSVLGTLYIQLRWAELRQQRRELAHEPIQDGLVSPTTAPANVNWMSYGRPRDPPEIDSLDRQDVKAKKSRRKNEKRLNALDTRRAPLPSEVYGLPHGLIGLDTENRFSLEISSFTKFGEQAELVAELDPSPPPLSLLQQIALMGRRRGNAKMNDTNGEAEGALGKDGLGEGLDLNDTAIGDGEGGAAGNDTAVGDAEDAAAAAVEGGATGGVDEEERNNENGADDAAAANGGQSGVLTGNTAEANATLRFTSVLRTLEEQAQRWQAVTGGTVPELDPASPSEIRARRLIEEAIEAKILDESARTRTLGPFKKNTLTDTWQSRPLLYMRAVPRFRQQQRLWRLQAFLKAQVRGCGTPLPITYVHPDDDGDEDGSARKAQRTSLTDVAARDEADAAANDEILCCRRGWLTVLSVILDTFITKAPVRRDEEVLVTLNYLKWIEEGRKGEAPYKELPRGISRAQASGSYLEEHGVFPLFLTFPQETQGGGRAYFAQYKQVLSWNFALKYVNDGKRLANAALQRAPAIRVYGPPQVENPGETLDPDTQMRLLQIANATQTTPTSLLWEAPLSELCPSFTIY